MNQRNNSKDEDYIFPKPLDGFSSFSFSIFKSFEVGNFTFGGSLVP